GVPRTEPYKESTDHNQQKSTQRCQPFKRKQFGRKEAVITPNPVARQLSLKRIADLYVLRKGQCGGGYYASQHETTYEPKIPRLRLPVVPKERNLRTQYCSANV